MPEGDTGRFDHLMSIPERVVWELCGCSYENFRQPPYHLLSISRPIPNGVLHFELSCPFPMDEHGEHTDLHYCTMVDCWPSMKLRTKGAVIEMVWRAIGTCFVCWEADNAGIEHLLDVGLRIPDWAKIPGQVEVALETFGELEDFTVWIAPIDPAVAALA